MTKTGIGCLLMIMCFTCSNGYAEYKWENGFEISVVAELPFPLRLPAVSTIGEKTYIIGGKMWSEDCRSTNCAIGSDNIFSFDATTYEVEALPMKLPYPMLYGMNAAPAADNKIYITPGGETVWWGEHTNMVEIDLNTNTASIKQAGFDRIIWDCNIASDGNENVLIFGGWDGGNASKDIYKYNFRKDELAFVHWLPYGINSCGMAVYDGDQTIYLFYTCGDVNKVFAFDLSTYLFPEIANIPIELHPVNFGYQSYWVDGPNIYLLSTTGTPARLLKFDTRAATFTDTGILLPSNLERSFPIAKHGDDLFIIGAGGYDNRATSTKVYKLTPLKESPPAPSNVYRFRNTQTGTHFYTQNEAEKDFIIAYLPWFAYEGVAWKAYSDNGVPNGCQPVYRFFNTDNDSHFYTIDADEKADIISDYDWFNYESIACFAYPGDTDIPAGALPVYRFYNNSTGGYFFTISEAEKDVIDVNYPWFRLEGVSWFAFPPDIEMPVTSPTPTPTATPTPTPTPFPAPTPTEK